MFPLTRSAVGDGAIVAVEEGKPRPERVWNKIPDEIGRAIVRQRAAKVGPNAGAEAVPRGASLLVIRKASSPHYEALELLGGALMANAGARAAVSAQPKSHAL